MEEEEGLLVLGGEVVFLYESKSRESCLFF